MRRLSRNEQEIAHGTFFSVVFGILLLIIIRLLLLVFLLLLFWCYVSMAVFFNTVCRSFIFLFGLVRFGLVGLGSVRFFVFTVFSTVFCPLFLSPCSRLLLLLLSFLLMLLL